MPTTNNTAVETGFPFFAFFAMSVVQGHVAQLLGLTTGCDEDGSYQEPNCVAHTYNTWWQTTDGRRFNVLLVLREDGTASCVADGTFMGGPEDEFAPWRNCILEEVFHSMRSMYGEHAEVEDILNNLDEARAIHVD